ncbi:MAG: hypothetical protein ACK5CA_08025 [Cyanobacteriota bacterium]
MHYDPAENRRRGGLHFLPVAGAALALYDLGSEHAALRRSARSALRLTLVWLLLYALLRGAGESLEGLDGARLIYLTALLSTGYFLTTLIESWRRLRGGNRDSLSKGKD